MSARRVRIPAAVLLMLCGACNIGDNRYLGGGVFLSQPFGASGSVSYLTAGNPGMTLQVEAGRGWAKAAVGGGNVDAEHNASWPYTTIATSGAVLWTLGDGGNLPGGCTYVGLEAKAMLNMVPTVHVAGYRKVGGSDGDDWIWAAGIGFGF